METETDSIRECILHGLGGLVLKESCEQGELCITIDQSAIVAVVEFLRNDQQCRFVSLIDICGVDWPERALRFDVVYHLLSPTLNRRIRIKLAADDENPVPSICSIYPGADWFEREVWDMYGVIFSDHPDLRRILTDYGFEGHPLRKDFPLTGFVEVRYDDTLKRVVYEPVQLRQDFRQFDFLSPWEGTDYVLPGDEKAEPSKQ
jgi:NADH-quinone oxidoreductase subunit C